MSKMKFLDPKEAEKFKNKSGKCFVGHPVVFFYGTLSLVYAFSADMGWAHVLFLFYPDSLSSGPLVLCEQVHVVIAV